MEQKEKQLKAKDELLAEITLERDQLKAFGQIPVDDYSKNHDTLLFDFDGSKGISRDFTCREPKMDLYKFEYDGNYSPNKDLAMLLPEMEGPLRKILKQVDVDVKASLAFRSSCSGLWSFGQKFPIPVELEVTFKSLECDCCQNWDYEESCIVTYIHWCKGGGEKRLWTDSDWWYDRPCLPLGKGVKDKGLSDQGRLSLEKCSQVALSINLLKFKVFHEMSCFKTMAEMFNKFRIQKIREVNIGDYDVSHEDLNQIFPKYKVEQVTGWFAEGGLQITHPEVRYIKMAFEDVGDNKLHREMKDFLETCSSPNVEIFDCGVDWETIKMVLKKWVLGDKCIEKWALKSYLGEVELLDHMEALADELKDHISMKLLPKSYFLKRADGKAVIVKDAAAERSVQFRVITIEAATE